MNLQQKRRELEQIRMAINHADDILKNLRDSVYEIENKLMDEEDARFEEWMKVGTCQR